MIDARTLRLPDLLTLPLVALGLAAAWVLNDPVFFALAGAGIGYLALVGLELAYKAIRGRDGLGRGDAKLLAAGGAWCGAAGLPMILLIASVSGLIFALCMRAAGRSDVSLGSRVAFGPFLALAIALVWSIQRATGG